MIITEYCWVVLDSDDKLVPFVSWNQDSRDMSHQRFGILTPRMSCEQNCFQDTLQTMFQGWTTMKGNQVLHYDKYMGKKKY